MAQRRAQIVGDGITERLQLGRSFGNTLLQFRVESAYFIFRVFALSDVADVALNHFFVTCLIRIADKLHGNAAVIPLFQWPELILRRPPLLYFHPRSFCPRLVSHSTNPARVSLQ